MPAPFYMGSTAINRSSVLSGGHTFLDKANPAPGKGHLTSAEVWFNSNVPDFRIGTFEDLGANVYRCFDSCLDLGPFIAGAKRTISGLWIKTKSGLFIGGYYSGGAGGAIERSTSGYLAIAYASGVECIDPGDSANFTTWAANAISLRAYGELDLDCGGLSPVFGVLFPHCP
jgi:hypothetical protein